MEEAGVAPRVRSQQYGQGCQKECGQRLRRLTPTDVCYSHGTFSLWASYLKPAGMGFSTIRVFPIFLKKEKRAMAPLLLGASTHSLGPPGIMAQGACLHLSSRVKVNVSKISNLHKLQPDLHSFVIH